MLSIKQLVLLPILDRYSKRAVHIDGARGWSAASSAAGGDGSEIDFVFVTPKIWCAYHSFLFLCPVDCGRPDGLNIICCAPNVAQSFFYARPIRGAVTILNQADVVWRGLLIGCLLFSYDHCF